MTTAAAGTGTASDALIAHQQSLLDAIQKDTSGTITEAFSKMIASFMPSAAIFRSAYTKELLARQDALEEAGGAPEDAKVSLHWLQTSGFLKVLLDNMQQELDKTAKVVAPAIQNGVQQARHAGRIGAVAMTAQAAGVPVNKATSMQLLQQAMALDDENQQQLADQSGEEPPEGVDETVDKGKDQETEFGDSIAAMPSSATQDARQSIFASVASGMSSQVVMLGVQTVLQGALTSMLGLGSSSAARGMQQSMLTIMQGIRMADGWIWTAENGACIACMEMDGSFHGWDEPFDSHPNCGCTPVAYSGPASGLDDIPTGEDWFSAQPDDVQEEILGPSKYLAWKSGDIQLMDLVSREGGMLHERSLKELGLDFRDYLQQLPTKRELLQLPDISIMGPHAGAELTAEERALWDEAQALVAQAAKMPELPEIRLPGETMGYQIRDEGGQGAALLNTTFGRELTPDEIGHMLGAQEGDYVYMGIRTVNGEDRVHFAVVSRDANALDPLHDEHAAVSASRTLLQDDNGLLYMRNDSISIQPGAQGEGLGARYFGEEVQQLSSMGVDRIEADALGNAADLLRDPTSANGFYTWARFGYQTNLADLVDEGLDLGALREAFPGVNTLQDLMLQDGGPAWWKANGVSFRGTFDLTEGSTSRQILDSYLQAKGIEIASLEKAVQEATTAAAKVIAPKDYSIKGVAFEMGPDERKELKAIFGRTISKNEIASWLQAGRDEVVQAEVVDEGVVSVQVIGDNHEAVFEFSRAADGRIVVTGDVSVAPDAQSVTSGRSILQGLRAMSDSGIDTFTMDAARGDATNGYITWARLHGTGDIPASVLKAAQAEFGDVTRVEEIMAAPGGPAWWRANGVTWEATFDLHAGSDTMNMVDRLLGIDRGVAGLEQAGIEREVSPAVKALQDQRVTLATQRDTAQAKLDTLSAKWRTLVLDQARFDPVDDAEEYAAAERKILGIEKQQATQLKRMDTLDAKMAKVDAKIQKLTPEVQTVASPFGTVEDIRASQDTIEQLFDVPVGDPMVMQEAAFGNNPYSLGGPGLPGADPELVAAVKRAQQMLDENISNLADRLADNRTFLRFARYMGYDQDAIGAEMVGWDNAVRAAKDGRALDEERAALAAMTREEAQAWASHEALKSTIYDIYEAFHSIPAAGDELFVQTPLQIAMQEAVKSEFGLKTAVGYWSDEAIAATKAEWGTYRNGIRAFFREMYDETQAYFQEHNISDITLFRGLRWTADKAPTNVSFDGHLIQSVVDGAPMSSWASNAEVALDYACDIGGTARTATESADVGMLLATKVPVSQILSIPQTGFGTPTLREMILLGKPEDALALPFTMDQAPTLDQFFEALATPSVTPEVVAEAAAAGEGGMSAASYTLPEIDQQAENAVIQAAKDALAGDGVASHADVMALGPTIDSYLQDRIGPLADYAQEAYQMQVLGKTTLFTPEQLAWFKGDNSLHDGISFFDAQTQYQAAMRDETARLLGEVRDVGGEISIADGADAAVVDAVDRIQQMLPSDWIDASNSQGDLTLLGETEKARGFYRAGRDGSGTIAIRAEGMNEADLQTAILHETGHRMQDAVNGLWLLEKELYNARTAGEDLVDINAAFQVVGRTKADKWAIQYMGKEPILVQRPGMMLDASGQKLRTIYNYELLSLGLEWLLGNDMRGQYFLAQDPEFRKWLLGVLFGAKDHVV